MITELVIGLGCIALGFYAVYKLSGNCIVIVYRRERSGGDVATRGGSRRPHFSIGRTFRNAVQALRDHGSLNVNFGANLGRGHHTSHNWSISRGTQGNSYRSDVGQRSETIQ